MGKEKNKKKGIISKLIFIIALCVFVYSGFNLAKNFYEKYKEKEETTELQKIVNIKKDDTGDSKKLEKMTIDFKKLQKINPDIVGWIVVEDTQISYPVVKGDDNVYYLNHSFKKEPLYTGAIFMDHDASADMNTQFENTFIYGHNVYHGTMFAELEKYSDKKTGASFRKKHPYVYYYTPKGNYKLEVFSSYVADGDVSKQKKFANADEYEKYLDKITKMSRYDTGVKVDAKDKIVTLYACSYENRANPLSSYDDNMRIYVHCKLIKALDGEMPYNVVK